MAGDLHRLLELAHTASDALLPEQEELRDRLSRYRVDKPVFMVDLSTPGIVAGAQETLAAAGEYASERGLEMGITETGSIGLTSEEPVVSVQMPGRTRLFFRKMTSMKVPGLLDDLFHGVVPEEWLIGQWKREGQEPWKEVPFLHEIPFFARQNRIVMADCGFSDPGSLEEYIGKGGYRAFLHIIRTYTFEEVCDLVSQSGLRGRSGSGYPTGEKWKVALDTPADSKFVICNAEESDPGAFMDRTLMEGDPYRLLEGIAIASYAIGSNRAYIYIRSEYTNAVVRIRQAILTLREAGLLGDNIMDSGYNLQISLRKGPGAFVCGEETALIASLEGRRGMPAPKPPYPAVSGFLGKPTVVNNVETLANLPAIFLRGPGWFRSTGVEDCAGTKIFSVSGRSRMTGLVEVPMGTSLDTIVQDIIGGTGRGRKLKAVHMGGPAGCMVPPDLMHIPVTYENLKQQGLVMGSGGILVMDDRTCVVDTVRYFMDYSDMQSCGKCIPCREGTRRMSEILGGITRKPKEEGGRSALDRFKGVMQMENLAGVMKDTSLCGLGQNASNPVISSLAHFREEYEEHIFDRKCISNSCTQLRSWHIDVDLCTGCSLCARRCPADAIIGTPKHPYFIVQEKCIGCGICHEACKFTAVSYE